MTIEYDQIASVVGVEGEQCGASALHGICTGLLVGNPAQSDDALVAWLQASEELEFNYNVDGEQFLTPFVAVLRKSVDSDEMGFEVLIPDESVPLIDRSLALGQWCEAFLFGLGTSQVRGEVLDSEDIPEILADFEKISQVDGCSDDEGDEALFMEVSEYVRVAVMLIYEQTRLNE